MALFSDMMDEAGELRVALTRCRMNSRLHYNRAEKLRERLIQIERHLNHDQVKEAKQLADLTLREDG